MTTVLSKRKAQARGKQHERKGCSLRFKKFVKRKANLESNEELRSIFVASPDAIVVTDLKGKIIDCNQAALSIYRGSSLCELIGKNAFTFIATRDRQKALENLKKTLAHGVIKNVEYTFFRKDGSEYPVELSAGLVKDSSGKPTSFVAIIKDITERKKIEKNIRESQQKFERLFIRIPEAAIFTDAKWRILDVNPRFTELFGYSLDEVRGKSPTRIIVPRGKLKESKMLGQKSKKGYTYYDTVRKKKDGTLVPVSISAAPIKVDGQTVGFVTLYKDMTEYKKTEKALRESEKKYRNVVNNIGVGVSVISPRMEILSLNSQMKKWFPHVDVSKRPVCYKSFNIPPRKRICTYCPTYKALKDGKTHEAITNTPSGDKIVNYRVVSSPIKDKDGKIIAVIEMVEDVTERKQLEEKLNQYSKHLEELVRERTQKLQESEERFRVVADYASEAIITINSHLRIIFWNQAAEIIFGYSSNEAISKPIVFIMPKKARRRYQKIMRRAFSRNTTQPVGKVFELSGLRKDGSEFPLELSFSVWKTKNGIFSTSIIRDITERKKMEERLATLNFYGRKLNAARSLQQIYKLTLEAVEKTLGFEYATFEIIEKDKIRVACHRGYLKPIINELPLDGSKKGIIVKVVKANQPVLVSDVSKDKDYVEVVPEIKSELAVPVITENKVLGVINVESKKLKAFDEKDLVLLQILASHAATAISNIKKRYEIEKRSNQLASLMKSSAEVIRSTNLTQNLQTIVEAIRKSGWRRVVLSLRDKNLEIAHPKDIVTAGLTKKEKQFLWINRQPGQVWRERFGPEFERFKIGEFYYLPWSDPWVRKKFSEGIVPSHLSAEEMVDWNPDDLLYAPLKLADGRIVGVVSMDDPVDGKRPTRNSLMPLELFLHQAAVAIEKSRLISQLTEAKAQIQEYAEHLEAKVEQRTHELMQKTEDLRKSEEKLRSIFAASPDAVVVTDLTGTIIECNQAALTMTDFSKREELIGKSAFEFIAEKDRQKIIENLKKTLEQGSVKNIEYTCITRNGKEFPAELSASVIRDASGKPVAFVGIMKDITERKLMEQKLLKSERLAAIGELAAMVGHDLRNPLTGIAGATYYLRNRLNSKTDKKAIKMLRLIEKSIEYSNKIISDLLDYSKELRLELVESTPYFVVNEALTHVKIPRNIRVFNLTQNQPMILIDVEKMTRVFSNIIKNAVDAMPNGGTLTIKSEITNGKWEISFTDTGMGMPKDVLEKIWAPFFTTKAKGMGLGLPICKRIVEAHDGKVSVESAIGKGTTFTVSVPVKPKIEEGGEEFWMSIPESLLSTTTKT